MSTTIDSLDIQITTSAGASAQNIEKLASALERLRSNAKLTTVTNNLNKLATTLNTLSGTNLSGMQKLSDAMASLSGTKTTGLNSTINALKKLPSVVDALDSATLLKFSNQMEKLSKALEPVAQKIDKISNGFSKLPANINRAVAAQTKMTSSTNKMGSAIDSANLNMFTMIGNYQTLISFLSQAISTVASFLDQAIGWDGIQFRFGRSFGEDAEEVYEYVQKLNEVLGINKQEFMQYSSMYGSLLSGFGLSQDKVTTISVGLSELTYDLWAANNDVVKRYEDVATAVKSAITGEIEPIRNLGIAMTEASLQEFIDGTNLAGMSIEKMTEAQKSEVRYAAMVNSAMNQGIVGTYAREMNTAEGAIRSLSQSTKSLVQALGSLFIPILQKVVPYVTAFVEIITEAVFYLASLFGVEIQEISWDSAVSGVSDLASTADDATTGLSDAADAAKSLKDYTMGFDELNVISPSTSSSSSDSGSSSGTSDWGTGLDLDTLWDDSVFDQASEKVSELKEKVKNFFSEWKTEIAIIAGALAALSIAKLLSTVGTALQWGESFLGFLSKIQKFASTALVITLQYMLMTEFMKSFIDGKGFKNYVTALFVGAIGSGIMYSMWGPAGLVIGLGVTAAASLKAVVENGGITNAESATVAFTGLASAVGAVFGAWKLLAKSNVGAFFTLLREGEPVMGTLSAAFPKLSNGFSTIGGWITKAASAVTTFVGSISAPVLATVAAVIAAIASTAYFLYENWDKVKKVAKAFFDQNIAPKLKEIKKHFDNIKIALGPVWEGLKKAKDNIAEFISNIKLPVLEGLGKVFETIGGIIFSVVGGTIAVAFRIVVTAIENFVQVFSGITNTVAGVIKFVVAMFKGDFSEIEEITEQITQGIGDLFGGLLGLVTDPLIDFVDGVIDWFTDLWDELVGHSIVPDTIDGIVDCFLSLPKQILKPLETFVNNVIDKFTGMWSSIKSWYTTNVKPKFTKKYWSDVFDTVRTGIGEKLDAVWSKLKDIWVSIKSWYTTNVKPKFTKKYWSDTFDTIRSSLGTKLDDAWDKVKSFFSVEEWKKKVSNVIETIKKNFKMPSLPKIKLEVTWSTNVGKLKTAVYEALGLDGWPSLKWSTYASGGFPDMGEMFIAREAGPELVGRIGNRTTVANNDQIVAAVSQGVYSAVRSAMGESSSGEGQNINVYLDGKQIYSSVKRVESRRGINLMGNQLGYMY